MINFQQGDWSRSTRSIFNALSVVTIVRSSAIVGYTVAHDCMDKLLINLLEEDKEELILLVLTHFVQERPNFYLNFDDIIKAFKIDRKIGNLVYYCFRGRYLRIRTEFFFKLRVSSIWRYKVKKKNKF